MDITVSDEVSQEYHELVKNILCNKEFLKLSLYTHHQWTTRLMHSINVSYLSWFIARASVLICSSLFSTCCKNPESTRSSI